ncbi:methylthioribose kinase [Aquisphaera giovannonii]|uniref:Methylthioribose kinase n=1 Tax=Aquisphaera giovannonii TaxID=406548 RepID=A0A5B9W5H5_9BACT|nr:phosphotransferase [Aquisphaera giovannonii]QEH35902.1 methylthioribose kinase [Aquisphaera giovannonii]
MRELTEANAALYLRESGRVPDGVGLSVRELAGGVSNVVLRVDFDPAAGSPPIVIKQCRERLRVAMEWLAPLDRIWAERSALGLLATILPDGMVPAVLFEDRDEYLFAMSCAPDDSATWKSHLMAGRIDPEIARGLGETLAQIHILAPGRPALRGELADRSLFEKLRVDPYYRTIARRHPEVAPAIESLIAAMDDLPEEERTLVLGDYSPKNILVHARGVVLLDFECAHAGDASFDLGFFMSHLLLKAVRADLAHPGAGGPYLRLADDFWFAYFGRLDRDWWPNGPSSPPYGRRYEMGQAHLAACLLARIDGKSPVEYLDEEARGFVRDVAIEALRQDPRPFGGIRRLLKSRLEARRGTTHGGG